VAKPVASIDSATADETDHDASSGPAAPVNAVVSRTWTTPAIRRRAVHGALAVAALWAILLLYEISKPDGTPPANGRLTASTTPQSDRVTAPDAIPSMPRISVGAESEHDLRDSKDGSPLQQPSPGRDPSELQDPRNDVAAQPTSAALPDQAIRALSQPSAELGDQVTEYRDTGEAERNRASTAELPTTSPERAGEVLDATFPDSELSPPTTRTGNDADDNLGPVPSTASTRETVSTSSDLATPVRDLLSGYQAAYASLDARRAKQIWPAVDERALERAFNALESQTVTFDTCDLTLNDRRAVASCRGRATYVTRIGRRSSHTESRQWTFLLEKPAERWIIGEVQIR
jgi:hypothetical protein